MSAKPNPSSVRELVLTPKHKPITEAGLKEMEDLAGGVESVLMEYIATNGEVERIMVGMADRLGGARYRGLTHLEPDDECSNTDCDALGPHERCFKDGRWLDDGSEM